MEKNWKTLTSKNRKENWTRVLKSEEGFLIVGVQLDAFSYEIGLWCDNKLIHLKRVEDIISAKESIKLLKNWAEENSEKIERIVERV